MVSITKEAAEKINTIKASQDEDKFLRLFTQDDSCHGMCYGLSFESKQDNDFEFEAHGTRFFVAADSLDHLKGIILDLDEEDQNEFVLYNPHASHSCCGGNSCCG